ncbi:hypothetical protein DJ83_07755 [Halorubrum ezzemoulense]|uniref:Uncharacterized protein n=1 Tax=Halorubrum ezzemoulense TaxID=337243 RepID=A0A256IYE6_HALEZ|nr:hypothetical protein [Halorubrum ezzemoulense]OYR61463.1 hypothetical protein DJ83_07755 [Halorubrum ezzemoulense]
MASQSGTHPAHRLRQNKISKLWTRLVLSLVPIDDLKTAREQVVEIYAMAYLDIGEFQEAFSEYSNPDLREWAVEPYGRIPNYDPHETVTSLLVLPEKVLGWLSKMLTVVVVATGLVSARRLYSLAMDGLRLIEIVEGAIPLTAIAVGIIYLWFLYADTLVHQALGEELRVGKAGVQTRRRAQIVGNGVWNRSLLGQTGLFLVGFFYILNALPELLVVGRLFDDPTSYFTQLITSNFDLFYQSDGLIDALRQLVRKET